MTVIYTSKTECPECGQPSVLEKWNPLKQPYYEIQRTICSKGHVHITELSILDPEKNRSKFPYVYSPSSEYTIKLNEFLPEADEAENVAVYVTPPLSPMGGTFSPKHGIS